MKYLHLLLLWALLLPVGLSAQQSGVLDSTFNLDGIVDMQAYNLNTAFFRVRLQADNKSLAFGYVRQNNVEFKAIVARFHEDGLPDPAFGNNGIAVLDDLNAIGYDGHLLADGKILIIGLNLSQHRVIISRLLPDGSPDDSFGTGGVFTVDAGLYVAIIRKSVIQPNGKIQIIGKNFDAASTVYDQNFVMQLLPDGTLDTTFGTNGITIIAAPNANSPFIQLQGGGIQSDGKLIVAGRIGNSANQSQWYMARLKKDGTLDPTFGNNGVFIENLGPTFAEEIFDVLVLPDGKIIAGGYAEKSPGFHFTMLRLHPDGSLDNSFGFGGKSQVSMDCCYSSIFGLIRQADGKILACGYAGQNLDFLNIAIARFKPGGLLDQTFGDGGKVVLQVSPASVSQRAITMALQPDGKILAAGYTDVNDGPVSGVLLRLYPGTIVGTGEPEEHALTGTEAFPNPLSGNNLHVKYLLSESTPVNMTLYDVTGRKTTSLLEWEMRPQGENREQIEIPGHIAPGSYFLRLETASGNQTLKIFKPE